LNDATNNNILLVASLIKYEMNLKNILLNLIIVCTCLFTKSKGQTFNIIRDRSFGGSKWESTVRSLQMANGNIILIGVSGSDISGDKTDGLCDPPSLTAQDIWMLEIDTAFNILWNKSIGGNRIEKIPLLSNIPNSTDFYFVCATSSDSSCEKAANDKAYPLHSGDYWLARCDTAGNILWNKTIGGTDIENAPHVLAFESGNIVLCGMSISPVGGDKTYPNYSNKSDYWIIKLDSVGNKLWDRVYGGTDTEESGGGINEAWLSMIESENESFLIAGTTSSPLSGDISDSSRGSSDIWIVKIDSTGNKLWDHRYGGTADDRVSSICRDQNGGFLVAGFTDSPQGLDVSDTSKGGNDVWILKLDSTGNKLWDKRYGGSIGEAANCITSLSSGDIIVSGESNSPAGGDVSENKYSLFGNFDYWVFKTDSIGNKKWDKRFGGTGDNRNSDFFIMADNSIVLTGTSTVGNSSVKSDSSNGLTDYWLIRFSYTDSLPNQIIEIPDRLNISIFPNPAVSSVTIKFGNIFEKGEMCIMDMKGCEIVKRDLSYRNQIEISTRDFTAGVYVVQLKSNGFSIFRKLIVSKL
jgi:hypothetical protein